MKELYIYTHLGVGDHIITNGLVRHYAELYERIFVFAKPQNKEKIIWMFRDNPNIRIISMGDVEARSFISFNKQNEYLIPGHQKLFEIFNNDKSKSFDELFYQLGNVPFEYKWDKFFIKRDIEKEKESFDSIKKKLHIEDQYAFVHDDETRRWKIHKRYISSDKIVRPSDFLNMSIFDIFLTIENASEVHCINSSFAALIDCIQLKNDNIFYHRYARTDMGRDGDSKLKLNWTFID